MFKIKKCIDSILSIIIFVIICISLSGCCGHSGGGNSVAPENKTTIGEVKVNNDGSVFFSGDGITLNALPDTFLSGTSIKITKVTGGNLLSSLGMDGKPITLCSEVYGLEISPEQEILNKAATVTIDLSPNYDSSRKQYFALNREIPVLITSENISQSLNQRAAKKKSIELGFVTTFSYVAAASLKTEVLSKDPSIWCDNSSKDVIKDKYTSDVAIFAQLSTKESIDKVFDGTSSFKVAIRTNDKKLDVLSHKSSPITSRRSESKSSLDYGSIDLTKVNTIKIDDNTIQYDAFFNSLNKPFQNIPRKVVIESVFTSKDNIPVCSQENVIYFRSPIRPYVINTYPANNDTITNINQIENIVVNFSEPMDTDSVEKAVSIVTQNKTYTGQSKDYKLTFNWSDNNKKLNINGNYELNTATGTFNVKISKSACSMENSNISKDAYSNESSDVEWSFNFVRKDFFVVMTSPKPGDINIPISQNDSSNKGPEITLTFSENINPRSDLLESAISLKSIDGESLKFSGNMNMSGNTYVLTPNKVLSYNKKYIIEVEGSIKNINNTKSLGEIYKASFITKELFASGRGSQVDPYIITNQKELDSVRNEGYINKDKYFKLANDIYYIKPEFGANYKAYWVPIGNEEKPFTGHFDGNNKSINNLDISHNGLYTGLFGKVVNSTISNLTITKPDIDGNEFVGSLAGYSVYSSIKNVKVTDIDINASAEKVGGLIGVANSTQISNCSVESSNNLFGTTDYCGGMVGILTANSTISNSYVKVLSNAELGGSDIIGGLVGYSEDSKIQTSKFYGVIKASSKEVGGIVGKASNSLISKCASIEGSASGSMNIGGICGSLISNSTVEQCFSSIDIAGSYNNIGGLVGNAENSSIVDSYVNNTTVNSSADCCGGLVGLAKSSSIDYCYSRAKVSGKDSVGGLVGFSEGSATISNSAALNEELAGTNKDNLNKVLGNGKTTINNTFSLSNMVISFVGTNSGSESYQHSYNNLDGIEKNNVFEIFTNIVLDQSIWLITNSEYPILIGE